MRIGITTNTTLNIWSSGMAQNVCFLYDILERAGAECYYLCEQKNPPQGLKGHKYIEVEEALNNESLKFDIILMSEENLTYPQIIAFKKRNENTQIILLNFYNKIIDDIEKSLFPCASLVNTYQGAPDLYFLLDEIWICPHHEYHISYLKTLFQNDSVKVMPYIWDPAFINDTTESINKEDLYYSPTNNKSQDKTGQICIFEANLSFSKNFLTPLMICENAYNRHDAAITSVNVFNCKKLRANKNFQQLTRTLNLVKDEKTYFNNRWSFLDAIVRWGGAIVSHQTINDLNYLHLECLHLGIPLIHNSIALQDAGYFYEGFNIEEGADQLRLALLQHSELFDYYQGKAKECIAKYSIYNNSNVTLYQRLIS